MSGQMVLTMPTSVLETLADATRTSLPWREPRPLRVHTPAPRPLVDALAVFDRPQLLLTLDVHHAAGRLRSWHHLVHGTITALTVAGTDRVELAWFPAGAWRDHLVRTATLPTTATPTVRAVLAARVHGRNRVGWVGGALTPAALAGRITRLTAGALS